VLRYWEEQGLISPSQERGHLRYGPRDLAIARLVRLLMEQTGAGVEGLRMLKALAQREVRAAAADQAMLAELALRLLYARKAFREVSGVDEERFGRPERDPPRPRDGLPRPPKPPPPHGRPKPPPRRRPPPGER
jgi:DNA-binding transcriptional MerR regulator